MLTGVYPGSFNPPTVAHLAVADAAHTHAALDRLDLVVSEVTLGKEDITVPTVEDRLAVLRHVAASRPWLATRRSPARLIADLAAGYDVVVMGADKWAQVRDPTWYGGSPAARDDALARLPRVLVAPRAGHPVTADDLGPAERLDVPPAHAPVSSSEVRGGRLEWMLPEAAAFDRRTGAWSHPERYRAARGSTNGPVPGATLP